MLLATLAPQRSSCQCPQICAQGRSWPASNDVRAMGLNQSITDGLHSGLAEEAVAKVDLCLEAGIQVAMGFCFLRHRGQPSWLRMTESKGFKATCSELITWPNRWYSDESFKNLSLASTRSLQRIYEPMLRPRKGRHEAGLQVCFKLVI